jgi:GNAT superfamily N-acetyltransferase
MRIEDSKAAVTVRPALRADVAELWRMIGELAVYERLEPEVSGSAEGLERHLFGPVPSVEGLLAEDSNGDPLGYALFYPLFSSFRTHTVAWLEDIFVRPAARGRGVGRALLAAVARRAYERGWGGVSWMVLDWNADAIGFYRSLGAQPDPGWTTYHLGGESYRSLAAAPGATPSAAPGAEGRKG